jgi:hypothetical protein
MKLSEKPLIHLCEALNGSYTLSTLDEQMATCLALEKVERLNPHFRTSDTVLANAMQGELGEIGVDKLLGARNVKFYHNREELTERYFVDGYAVLELGRAGAQVVVGAEIKTLDFTGLRRKWATFPVSFRENMERHTAREADVIIINRLVRLQSIGIVIRPWLLLDPRRVAPFLMDGRPEGTVYLALDQTLQAGAAVLIQKC